MSDVAYSAPMEMWDDVCDILIAYSTRPGASLDERDRVAKILKTFAKSAEAQLNFSGPPPAAERPVTALTLAAFSPGDYVQFFSDQKHVANCRAVVEKIAKKYLKVRLLDPATNSWPKGAMISTHPANVTHWTGERPT